MGWIPFLILLLEIVILWLRLGDLFMGVALAEELLSMWGPLGARCLGAGRLL